jgi:hypothetical protein
MSNFKPRHSEEDPEIARVSEEFAKQLSKQEGFEYVRHWDHPRGDAKCFVLMRDENQYKYCLFPYYAFIDKRRSPDPIAECGKKRANGSFVFPECAPYYFTNIQQVLQFFFD